MASFPLLLSAVLFLSIQTLTVESKVLRINRRSRREALPFPYLASKMLGLRQELVLNLAESFQNDQLNFGSMPSENHRGKTVFPSAPFEGTDLVNNGTGFNIAYGGKSECQQENVHNILTKI